MVFDGSRELDDPQVPDGLKVISNESMHFNDIKELNIPHVLIFNPLTHNFDCIFLFED